MHNNDDEHIATRSSSQVDGAAVVDARHGSIREIRLVFGDPVLVFKRRHREKQKGFPLRYCLIERRGELNHHVDQRRRRHWQEHQARLERCGKRTNVVRQRNCAHFARRLSSELTPAAVIDVFRIVLMLRFLIVEHIL